MHPYTKRVPKRFMCVKRSMSAMSIDLYSGLRKGTYGADFSHGNVLQTICSLRKLQFLYLNLGSDENEDTFAIALNSMSDRLVDDREMGKKQLRSVGGSVSLLKII
jgi:hypothetical protein